jgi:hypothetical protein
MERCNRSSDEIQILMDYLYFTFGFLVALLLCVVIWSDK